MIEYGFAFSAGLLGGLHCAGMCGPIVLGYTSTPVTLALPGGEVISYERKYIASLVPHLFYNGGRVISYAMVGGLAGTIGATFILGAGLRAYVSIVLGALMILAGLAETQLLRKPKAGFLAGGAIANIIKDVLRTDTLESRFMLGFVTPLLPCGLLYGMVFGAASSGSPVGGAIMMALFAMASAPALVIVGMLAGVLKEKARRYGTRLAGIIIIAMGIVTIARGAGIAPPWMMEINQQTGSVQSGAAGCCKAADSNLSRPPLSNLSREPLNRK